VLQAYVRAEVRLALVVRGVGVVLSQDGGRGLEDAHWICLLGHEREGLVEIAGNGPGGGELAEEAIELGPSGKLAHPQQMGDFLEAGLAREVVDVVPA